MTTDLNITDWQTWRQESDGTIIPLPSGKIVKVRVVSIELFLQLSQIPQWLVSVVSDMLGESNTQALEKLDEIESIKANNWFLNQVAHLAIIEPPVSLELDPPDGFISVFQIEKADKEFLFELLGMGASQLEFFREKALARFSGLDNRQALQPTAEPTAQSE